MDIIILYLVLVLTLIGGDLDKKTQYSGESASGNSAIILR